jgi:hypothetical protein
MLQKRQTHQRANFFGYMKTRRKSNEGGVCVLLLSFEGAKDK